MPSWIDVLRKEALVVECQFYGIDSEGTREQLCQRLKEYYSSLFPSQQKAARLRVLPDLPSQPLNTMAVPPTSTTIVMTMAGFQSPLKVTTAVTTQPTPSSAIRTTDANRVSVLANIAPLDIRTDPRLKCILKYIGICWEKFLFVTAPIRINSGNFLIRVTSLHQLNLISESEFVNSLLIKTGGPFPRGGENSLARD
jgi:hypothetical protein